MIRIYLKQAWALIREERLFSAIYIVGTGLAITLVMVLSIVFYVKVAPVYPELNRERTLSLRFGRSLGDGMTFTSLGGPDRHWESLFRYWSNQAPDVSGELFRYGMVFFFLLLVPAVSLSGLADSRMERRLAEMGARRAFGAPRGALMGQVLTENLLYTLLGGALGLLFSFAVAYGAREWIFKIGKGFTAGPMAGVEQSFPLDGLLNPWVFLIALAVCFVLNLMSTLWPAWRAALMEPAEALRYE